MRKPRFLQLHDLAAAPLAAEAVAGLSAAAAHVSPKFFYDALGSRLFEAITELDEYYPKRAEASILTTHAVEIATAAVAATGANATLVDLGAGNCAKAARLFGPLAPSRYVAVDISVDFLREALSALQRQHEAIDMVGVGLDFSTRLALPAGVLDGPALVFYPGSSIGNFSPADALRLLRECHALANGGGGDGGGDSGGDGGGGGLLIGVDRVKADALLNAAYDDPLGVTAAFNLNLLRHLNRLIGSDFDPRQWRHIGEFNRAASRVEMHLEARAPLLVRWPGGERRFAAGERIHTENSYKWQPADFEALLRDAGFAHVEGWTDAQGWFSVMLAR